MEKENTTGTGRVLRTTRSTLASSNQDDSADSRRAQLEQWKQQKQTSSAAVVTKPKSHSAASVAPPAVRSAKVASADAKPAAKPAPQKRTVAETATAAMPTVTSAAPIEKRPSRVAAKAAAPAPAPAASAVAAAATRPKRTVAQTTAPVATAKPASGDAKRVKAVRTTAAVAATAAAPVTVAELAAAAETTEVTMEAEPAIVSVETVVAVPVAETAPIVDSAATAVEEPAEATEVSEVTDVAATDASATEPVTEETMPAVPVQTDMAADAQSNTNTDALSTAVFADVPAFLTSSLFGSQSGINFSFGYGFGSSASPVTQPKTPVQSQQQQQQSVSVFASVLSPPPQVAPVTPVAAALPPITPKSTNRRKSFFTPLLNSAPRRDNVPGTSPQSAGGPSPPALSFAELAGPSSTRRRSVLPPTTPLTHAARLQAIEAGLLPADSFDAAPLPERDADSPVAEPMEPAPVMAPRTPAAAIAAAAAAPKSSVRSARKRIATPLVGGTTPARRVQIMSPSEFDSPCGGGSDESQPHAVRIALADQFDEAVHSEGGHVLTVAVVAANKRTRDLVGSTVVATPVRRSLRVASSQPTTPHCAARFKTAEDVLAMSHYAFTPNKAINDGAGMILAGPIATPTPKKMKQTVVDDGCDMWEYLQPTPEDVDAGETNPLAASTISLSQVYGSDSSVGPAAAAAAAVSTTPVTPSVMATAQLIRSVAQIAAAAPAAAAAAADDEETAELEAVTPRRTKKATTAITPRSARRPTDMDVDTPMRRSARLATRE